MGWMWGGCRVDVGNFQSTLREFPGNPEETPGNRKGAPSATGFGVMKRSCDCYNEMVSRRYVDLNSTCQRRSNIDLILTLHRPHINFVKLYRKIVPCVTSLLRAHNTRLHVLPVKCILIRIRQTPFFRPLEIGYDPLAEAHHHHPSFHHTNSFSLG